MKNILILTVFSLFSSTAFSQSAEKKSMKELINLWRTEDLETRIKTSNEIIERYQQWADEDLNLLDDSADQADAEISERSKKAYKVIIWIKKIGIEIYKTFPDAIEILSEETSFSKSKIQLKNDSMADTSSYSRKQALLNSIVSLYKSKNINNCSGFLIEMLKDDAQEKLELTVRASTDMQSKLHGYSSYRKHNIPSKRLMYREDMYEHHHHSHAPKLYDKYEYASSIGAIAMQQIIYLKLTDGSDELVKILKNNYSNFVKSKALQVLGSFTDKKYAKDISEFLKSEDSDLKLKSAVALLQMGAKEYAPEIFDITSEILKKNPNALKGLGN